MGAFEKYSHLHNVTKERVRKNENKSERVEQ